MCKSKASSRIRYFFKLGDARKVMVSGLLIQDMAIGRSENMGVSNNLVRVICPPDARIFT